MTDTLISALTSTAALATTDEVVLNQDAGGGSFVTKRITISDFKSELGVLTTGGALGTPSSGTLTNCTNLPISTGVSGLGTGVATLLAGTPSGTGGLAGTASPTFTGDINQSYSVAPALTHTMTNTNAATTAYSFFQLSNGTAVGGISLYGTGFTTSGMDRQNGVKLLAAGAGGLTLATTAAQPLYFGVNGTERARIDTNGYALLGYTSSQGAYKLQVSGDAYVSGKVNASNLSSQTGTTAAATINTWYNTASISGLGYGVFTFWATTYTGASWCSKIFMIENGNGYVKTVVDGAASGMEIQFSGANIQVRNTTYSGYPISWGLTKLG